MVYADEGTPKYTKMTLLWAHLIFLLEAHPRSQIFSNVPHGNFRLEKMLIWEIFEENLSCEDLMDASLKVSFENNSSWCSQNQQDQKED